MTWHRTERGSWAATANIVGGGSSTHAGVPMKEILDGLFFAAHPFLNGAKIQQAYAEVTTMVSHVGNAQTSIGTHLIAAM
jgi:hypothetical protein